MELTNLIINIFVAIGTVGAVVLSLWNIITENRPKYKVIKHETILNKDRYYTLEICNIGKIPFIIKNVGFSNHLEQSWYNFAEDILLIKKDYKDEDFSSKIEYKEFPVKLYPLESIQILITHEEVLKLKQNMKYKKVYIKIIFFDESKKKCKILMNEIDKFLENHNLVNNNGV
ncbi:MAG TPA: hypothetical protein GXZ48_05815 [Acholeplasmataceae bacterium]|nr:hypothetical protein [Acholeplasmataceae bacterium]